MTCDMMTCEVMTCENIQILEYKPTSILSTHHGVGTVYSYRNNRLNNKTYLWVLQFSIRREANKSEYEWDRSFCINTKQAVVLNKN